MLLYLLAPLFPRRSYCCRRSGARRSGRLRRSLILIKYFVDNLLRVNVLVNQVGA
jgi:hypothetical protein